MSIIARPNTRVSKLISGSASYTAAVDMIGDFTFFINDTNADMNANIRLQCSVDGGVTYRTIDVYTAGGQWNIKGLKTGASWRAGCSAGDWTSGVLDCGLMQ